MSKRTASSRPKPVPVVEFWLPAVEVPSSRLGQHVYAPVGNRMKRVGRIVAYLLTDEKGDKYAVSARVAPGTTLYMAKPKEVATDGE